MPGYNASWTGTLTNSDIQDFLQKQTIMTFASTSARDTALSSELRDGLWAYTTNNPKTLWLYNGTEWVRMWTEWLDWTPTFAAGVTVGDGTFAAAYRYEGGALHIRGQFVLGSSSAVSAIPQITLPASFSAGTYPNIGSLFMRDATGPTWYSGVSLVGIGSSTINLIPDGSSVSSTAPFTWTTSDLMAWDIVVTND